MVNRAAIENYFKLLKEVLDEHALLEKPAQIYNVDELGIPLDHCPPHVVVKMGQRKVCYCTAGNKNQVTVVGCINAAGLHSLLIFDVKYGMGEGRSTRHNLWLKQPWLDR